MTGSLQLRELSFAITHLIESPPHDVTDIDVGCTDHLKEPQYGRDYISYLKVRP